jgi:hypothetical protein
VAEGGGESRVEGLSKMFSSVEVGVEVDKGVIGRGLSGDGVRGIERKGGAFGFSLMKAPSMMMLVVGRESTRVSKEKEVEELIRNIGVGMTCIWASFGTARERAGGRGRSGERGGRGGHLQERWSSGP